MTAYDPNKHHRRSIRLKDYDYTQAGAYFVTMVTHNRECLFGNAIDSEMRLNECGQIIHHEWLQTAQLRPYVELDEYVVMPNHFHGILVIVEDDAVGARRDVGARRRRAPITEQFGKPIAGSLPTIIRAFKSATTKHINEMRNTQGADVWQRNYHEHIIRNERELTAIRVYIANNPANWSSDAENPKPSQS